MAKEAPSEGACPASLEDMDALREGQVWELNVGDRLEPSVLLQLYVGKFGRDDQDYWRCLSLERGIVFSASTRRWDPSRRINWPADDLEVVPLVGRRLL